MVETKHCNVKMTFSKTVPPAQAEGAALVLIHEIGEGGIVNLVNQQDGNVNVAATLSCQCFKEGKRVYGTCLAQSLRKKGLPFPADAEKECIQKKAK